jgi:hypothetical protein
MSRALAPANPSFAEFAFRSGFFRSLLAHAALIRPRATMLVHAIDVLEESVMQLAKQRAQLESFAVLQAMRCLQDLSQHPVVFGAKLP